MDIDREKSHPNNLGDARFHRYLWHANLYALLFALLLSLFITALLFFTRSQQEQVSLMETLLVSILVSTMFLSIAMYSIISRMTRKDWVGKVVDKKKYQKIKNNHVVIVYELFIQKEDGKMHRVAYENNELMYDYYRLHDKVHYVGKFNALLKLDKSQDSKNRCIACGTIASMDDSVCPRCHCPLIK